MIEERKPNASSQPSFAERVAILEEQLKLIPSTELAKTARQFVACIREQQAALEFALGRFEVGVRQGTFNFFLRQFGELVAENGEVGGFPVSWYDGVLKSEPQGRQQDSGHDDDLEDRKNGEERHEFLVSFKRISMCRVSSSDRGASSVTR